MSGYIRKARLNPELEQRAPREARRFVAAELEKLGRGELVDDAVLVVSELVTNSMCYAPGLPVDVVLCRMGPCLWLEVWDCSPELPKRLEPAVTEEHGRGVQIAGAVSMKIGSARVVGGKVTWTLLAVLEDDYLRSRLGESRCTSGLGWPENAASISLEGRCRDGRQLALNV